MTILQIKIVHTFIFFVLSGCVLYALYSGVSNRITRWTWVAVTLVLIEGVVLLWCGWKCPLTILAERLGANQGGVVDIFLPLWFADRIFPVCGTTFLVALAILVARVFGVPGARR